MSRTTLNNTINTKLATGSDITAAELREVHIAQADYGDEQDAVLSAQIAGKQPLGDYATNTALTSGLAGKAPINHNHTSTNITDFVEAVQDAVALLLGAGSNVILNYDDASNSLSISATGAGGTGLDAEQVRDAIGVAMVGIGNITVTVNDAADTITITTTATQNITDAASATLMDSKDAAVLVSAKSYADTKALGWFNVLDRGADKTGVTDATTAINNAIAAAAPYKGTVYLPSGTYKISGTIHWNTYVNLTGENWASTIFKSSAATVMLDCNVQNSILENTATISNIQFDGNNIGVSALDLRFQIMFRHHHLYIHHFTGYSTLITGCIAGEFNTCHWIYNANGAIKGSKGTDAINGNMQSNCVMFTNCIINYTTNAFAVDWSDAAGLRFLNNCIIENNGTDGNSNTGFLTFSNPSPTGEGVGLVMDNCWAEAGKGIFIKINNAGTENRSIISNTVIKFGSPNYNIHLTGSNGNKNIVSIINSSIGNAATDVYATGANAVVEVQNSFIGSYNVLNSAKYYQYQPSLITTGGGGGDVTAPTVSSATATSTTNIRVAFSETMGTVTTAGWTFNNGSTVTPSEVALVSGSTYDFTVGGLAYGQTITMSYNPSTGATTDLANNEVATITASSVTNSIAGGSNLFSSSSDFSSWTATGVTPASAQTSYDGSSNATLLTTTAAGGKHFIVKTLAKSGIHSYTLTLYMKPNSVTNMVIDIESAAGNGLYVTVNATTGAVVASGDFGTGYLLGTPIMTSAANGYYQLSMPFTSDAESDMTVYFFLANGTSTIFTGDGISGMYIANAVLQ